MNETTLNLPQAEVKNFSRLEEVPFPSLTEAAIWPRGVLHSTDPRWKPNNHEGRLLDLVARLIVDVVRTHPAVTQRDVLSWLAKGVER